MKLILVENKLSDEAEAAYEALFDDLVAVIGKIVNIEMFLASDNLDNSTVKKYSNLKKAIAKTLNIVALFTVDDTTPATDYEHSTLTKVE